jgi:hypothetical protein
MENIRCWCGSERPSGKMHYPGGDPENGPAHPARHIPEGVLDAFQYDGELIHMWVAGAMG